MALAALCPGMGAEASAAAVAVESGLRHGATTLALRGLERRRLVTGHGDDQDPRYWTPTLTGRAHAKHIAAREARDRADDHDARIVREEPARGEGRDGGGAEPA